MVRTAIGALALCVVSASVFGQVRRPASPPEQPASRAALGVRNEFLRAGSEALLAEQYDEGIRLTKLGLELATAARDRSCDRPWVARLLNRRHSGPARCACRAGRWRGARLAPA